MVRPFLLRRALLAVTVLLLVPALRPPAAAAPEGTLTWGLHVTLTTKWLDPSDTEAFINPFMVLYAVHDALVKPMPTGENTRASRSPGRSRRTASSTSSAPYEDLRLKAPR